MRHHLKIWFEYLFFMALLFPALSQAGELDLTKDDKRYAVVPVLHYFIDAGKEMSFEDIRHADRQGRFIKNEKSSLNFGFSDLSYWVRFRLTGETTSESGWYLELTYSPIDLYTLYIPDKSGQYKTRVIGDHIPFADWDVHFCRPTLSLGTELPINQSIYLNIRSSAVVNISPVLWNGSQFYEHVADAKLLFGIYYGIMIALVIYNFFIFLSIRDINYLLYIAFILAYIMSQVTYNGFGYQYFWPFGNWFADFSYPFFMGLVLIFMTFFARSFLQIKQYLPKVDLTLKSLIGVYMFTSVSEPLVGMKFASTLTAFGALYTVPCIYISAIIIFLKGLREARFFLLAWTVFIFGLITLIFKMLGIFPHNFFTEYAMQIGSAVEGLLLSLALADRINILKRDIALAQARALEEMKKSESIKTQYLEKAEKLVKERTRELMKTKNELEKLARVDALTGLFNRRVFDEMYKQHASLAERTGHDFSLLVIDVDYFKKFNDRYGHQKGDECLKAVSSCMQKNVRRVIDTLARYGGEEFAVIMSETDTENALRIAEKIRKDVELLSIPHKASPFGIVTISLGLATLEHGVGMSYVQLFEKADHALYQSKNTGRNKICFI